MNDHNKRIQKQLLAAAENLEIHEIEHRAEPLIIVVVVFCVALMANSLMDSYAAHKYKSQVDAASAFASCLNGQQIEIGDSLARCKVENYHLS